MNKINTIEALGNGNYLFQDINNSKIILNINEIDKITEIIKNQYTDFSIEIKNIINKEFGNFINIESFEHSFFIENRDVYMKKSYKDHLFNSKKLLSIDFGTSYSYIGMMLNDSNYQLVPDNNGKFAIPSVITFTPNKTYYVGYSAIKHINKQNVTITNVKRKLGTNENINVFGKIYSPEVIASLIIKNLIQNAKDYFDIRDNINVMLSIPANFNIKRENSLIRSLQLSNVHIYRIVSESEVVSLVTNKILQWNHEITLLVIDLGGGTFDISVAEIDDGVFETKLVIGDNYLGGIDYDYVIEKYLKSAIIEANLVNDFNEEINTKIIQESERIKKALSTELSTFAIISEIEAKNGNLIDFKIEISRELFEKLTTELNIKIRDYLLIAKSKLLDSEIPKKVLLSGQGAKIFTVKKIINEVFPNFEIIDDYQENGVILGVLIYSGILTGVFKNILQLNVLRNSIAFKYKEIVKKYDKEELAIFGSRKDGIFIISQNSAENDKIYPIIDFNTTIPVNLYKTFLINKGYTCLELFEISNSSSEKYSFEYIELYSNVDKNEISLKIDVDANSLIFLEINYNSENSQVYKLNKHYENIGYADNKNSIELKMK